MKPCYTTGRSGVQLLGPDSLGACSLRMRYENVFREGQIGLSTHPSHVLELMTLVLVLELEVSVRLQISK